MNDSTVDFTSVAFLTSIPISSCKCIPKALRRNISSSLLGKELGLRLSSYILNEEQVTYPTPISEYVSWHRQAAYFLLALKIPWNNI